MILRLKRIQACLVFEAGRAGAPFHSIAIKEEGRRYSVSNFPIFRMTLQHRKKICGGRKNGGSKWIQTSSFHFHHPFRNQGRRKAVLRPQISYLQSDTSTPQKDKGRERKSGNAHSSSLELDTRLTLLPFA